MEIADIYGELPIIETERLILRKLTIEDLEDMFAYASDDEITKYVTWNTHRTLADTKIFFDFALQQYEKKKVAPWGIQLKEHRKLIGTVDFVSWQPTHKMAEIGYVLSREYWGKGITTEAAQALIEFGFSKMELVRISARCFVDNTASQRVMEKLGMSYEGTMRKGMYIKGVHQDIKLYSILLEEFNAKKNLNKQLPY